MAELRIWLINPSYAVLIQRFKHFIEDEECECLLHADKNHSLPTHSLKEKHWRRLKSNRIANYETLASKARCLDLAFDAENSHLGGLGKGTCLCSMQNSIGEPRDCL